jgi:hypothetical protein
MRHLLFALQLKGKAGPCRGQEKLRGSDRPEGHQYALACEARVSGESRIPSLRCDTRAAVSVSEVL